MRIENNYSLEKYNTFHFAKALVYGYYRIHLIIGKGSNLLFINDFNGIILHSAIKGMEVTQRK